MIGTTSGPTEFLVKLRRRTEVAEGTTAFSFEKPANFVFKAGQFLEFTLTNPPETDAEGDSRAFSIASAPHEEMLMIATRMPASAVASRPPNWSGCSTPAAKPEEVG
jgi:ferredoxin-NADP reductase